MSAPIDLRVVLFREGRFWLAQGLDHDIGVQGEDLHDLIARFAVQLAIEGAGLAALPPAPPYFQALWPLRAGAFVPEADPAPDGCRIAWGLVA